MSKIESKKLRKKKLLFTNVQCPSDLSIKMTCWNSGMVYSVADYLSEFKFAFTPTIYKFKIVLTC